MIVLVFEEKDRLEVEHRLGQQMYLEVEHRLGQQILTIGPPIAHYEMVDFFTIEKFTTLEEVNMWWEDE